MPTEAEIIPQRVQDFATEFAALAIKHGLREAHVNLGFGWDAKCEWDNPIQISWKSGRHGDSQKEFHISTTLHLYKRM